jgi:hypothetical protein
MVAWLPTASRCHTSYCSFSALAIIDHITGRKMISYFGSVRHQFLQNLKPLVDPFPSSLHFRGKKLRINTCWLLYYSGYQE